jgi:hypothetical protein
MTGGLTEFYTLGKERKLCYNLASGQRCPLHQWKCADCIISGYPADLWKNAWMAQKLVIEERNPVSY